MNIKRYKEIARIIGLSMGLVGIIIGFWDITISTYIIVLSLWAYLVYGGD